MRNFKTIAIDFDGTIFETDYPTILRPIVPVIEAAKDRREDGDRLILWTCREGAELDAAIEACREQGLEFDAVNDNLPEAKEEWGNNPRKIAADEYWDDRSVLPWAKFDGRSWDFGLVSPIQPRPPVDDVEATRVTIVRSISQEWEPPHGEKEDLS